MASRPAPDSLSVRAVAPVGATRVTFSTDGTLSYHHDLGVQGYAPAPDRPVVRPADPLASLRDYLPVAFWGTIAIASAIAALTAR